MNQSEFNNNLNNNLKDIEDSILYYQNQNKEINKKLSDLYDKEILNTKNWSNLSKIVEPSNFQALRFNINLTNTNALNLSKKVKSLDIISRNVNKTINRLSNIIHLKTSINEIERLLNIIKNEDNLTSNSSYHALVSAIDIIHNSLYLHKPVKNHIHYNYILNLKAILSNYIIKLLSKYKNNHEKSLELYSLSNKLGDFSQSICNYSIYVIDIILLNILNQHNCNIFQLINKDIKVIIIILKY